MEKSNLDEIYENLAHMCQKLFSMDGTTFGAICGKLYDFVGNNKIKETKKLEKTHLAC